MFICILSFAANLEREWRDTDLRKSPTNAFGKIEFLNEALGGRIPAKVIIVTIASLRQL